MSQQAVGYQSVYGEPFKESSGKFVAFIIRINEHADQYGYWRFASETLDDARAYEYGFLNPEHLFYVYQSGGGGPWHIDINLTWYPGKMDNFHVRRTGTAGQHMAAIAEERILLGLPPILAHELPMYPISSDPRLLVCRQSKYYALRISNSLGPLHPRLDTTTMSSECEADPSVVPNPSADLNLAPSRSRHRPIIPSGDIRLQQRLLPSAIPLIREHIKAEGTVILAAPQATNQSLVTQTRAQATALVAFTEGTVTHPVPRPRGKILSHHQKDIREQHVSQPRAAQPRESQCKSSFTGGTSSSLVDPDTPYAEPSLASIPRPNQVQQALSSSSQLMRPGQTWHSPVFNQLPKEPLIHPSPSRQSPALYPSSKDSQYKSLYSPLRISSNPTSPYVLRGLSPQVSARPLLPQPVLHLPDIPKSQTQNSILGLPEHGDLVKSHLGVIHSPLPLAVSNTPATLPSTAPFDPGLDAVLEFTNVYDKSTFTENEATTKQDSEIMDPKVSKGAEAGSVVAIHSRDLAVTQLQQTSLLRPAIALTIPTVTSTTTNKNHAVHAEQRESGQNNNSVLNPRLICAVCKLTTTFQQPWTHLCSGCRSLWYCGRVCRSQDWRSHIRVCEKAWRPRSALPSIPFEVPEIRTPYDPNDEFTTALVPLSEDVPCMICEGTITHRSNCVIADFRFGPFPDYSTAMLRELREQVNRFDPEQWREHQNLLEPDSIQEMIPEMVRIIRNDITYKDNPVLHGVPDSWLPLVWPLVTSSNIGIQLLTSNGEIYAPDHPVWADSKGDDMGEANGHDRVDSV